MQILQIEGSLEEEQTRFTAHSGERMLRLRRTKAISHRRSQCTDHQSKLSTSVPQETPHLAHSWQWLDPTCLPTWLGFLRRSRLGETMQGMQHDPARFSCRPYLPAPVVSFSRRVGTLVTSTGLHSPKSDSFMWPSTPRSRLSGLMSLHEEMTLGLFNKQSKPSS